ncbi:MAG: hypothetical protein ACHQTE_01170 [Candidatus Saccharimonadales bacterium]
MRRRQTEQLNFATQGDFEYASNQYDKQSNHVLGIVAMSSAALVAAGFVGVGGGLVIGWGQKAEGVETTSSGQATIHSIDKTYHDESVIGFKSQVDGGTSKFVEPLSNPLHIPIPNLDIVTTEQLDGFVVDSSLCFKGGKKDTTYNETTKHYVTTIDPADISVCSKEDPMIIPVETPGGNFFKDIGEMKGAAAATLKAATGIDWTSPAKVAEQNALRAKLRKDNKNAAFKLVNEQCGPKVFSATQEEVKGLIIDDLNLQIGQTAEVVFKVNADGKVAITGQSDIDKYFENTDGRTHTVKSIGACAMPKDFKYVAPVGATK